MTYGAIAVITVCVPWATSDVAHGTQTAIMVDGPREAPPSWPALQPVDARRDAWSSVSPQ
jgi:hypothetical protein